MISIHTLLAESDLGDFNISSFHTDFNPHSPRREWPNCYVTTITHRLFQSTLSSQRVTFMIWNKRCLIRFQSTLSSQRVTFMIWNKRCLIRFQSTLSSQRVTFSAIGTPTWVWFQSTLSSQRVTSKRSWFPIPILISIHTLLAESDSKISQKP